MDSCNTMCGKKNGVEVCIQKNKALHLLNIDSNTFHINDNYAKKFALYFINCLENTFDDILL